MRLIVVDAERCVGCQICMFTCSLRQNEPGLAKTCIGVKSAGGMERGFVVVVCRACEDPPCLKVCPTDALKLRKGGGVRLVEEKCIGCGYCKDVCMVDAVFWDNEINKPMICIHCGICAKYCPHGVIALNKEKEVAAHVE